MFFATPIAYGHHSFPVLFDPSQTVTVTGVVTEFEFRAPHCYIRVAAQDANGVQIAWELETTSPGQLIRIGLTPDTLLPGSSILAVGNPTRDGRPLMRLLTITIADGEEIRMQ
jgi:hypothetical protein